MYQKPLQKMKIQQQRNNNNKNKQVPLGELMIQLGEKTGSCRGSGRGCSTLHSSCRLVGALQGHHCACQHHAAIVSISSFKSPLLSKSTDTSLSQVFIFSHLGHQTSPPSRSTYHQSQEPLRALFYFFCLKKFLLSLQTQLKCSSSMESRSETSSPHIPTQAERIILASLYLHLVELPVQQGYIITVSLHSFDKYLVKYEPYIWLCCRHQRQNSKQGKLGLITGTQ